MESNARIITGVPLYILDREYPADIVVSTLNDEMLLGWDFLIRYNCILDCGNKVLVIDGRRVPITDSQDAHPGLVNKLRSISRVVIPAFSAKATRVCPEFPGTRDLPVESADDNIGPVTLLPGLAHGGAEVTVIACNTSHRPVVIEPATVLGSAENYEN